MGISVIYCSGLPSRVLVPWIERRLVRIIPPIAQPLKHDVCRSANSIQRIYWSGNNLLIGILWATNISIAVARAQARSNGILQLGRSLARLSEAIINGLHSHRASSASSSTRSQSHGSRSLSCFLRCRLLFQLHLSL